MTPLKAARPVVSRAIGFVTNGGPFQADGLLQNAATMAGETVADRPAEPAATAARVNFGSKQNLGSVDISDAGSHPLIEQGHLDRPPRRMDGLVEPVALEAQGVGADRRWAAASSERGGIDQPDGA